MPYFNNNISTVKLCVLYMLKILKSEITAPLLTIIIEDSTNMMYFDIQLAISELEDTGSIASVQHPYGICYALTPHGSEVLSTEEKNLPKSIREACDKYVSNNRIDVMRSEQIQAHSRKTNTGSWEAVMSSLDKNGMVMSVVVNVLDKATADMLCKNWKSSSHKAYSAVIDALSDPKE